MIPEYDPSKSTAHVKGVSAGILKAMQDVAAAHYKHARAMETAARIINTAFRITAMFSKKPHFIKKYSRIDQRFPNRFLFKK